MSDEFWFSEFHAGRLSPEEEAARAAELIADRKLVRRYLRWNAFEHALRRQLTATAARHQAGWESGAFRRIRPRPYRRHARTWLWSAAAAIVLLGLGLGLRTLAQSESSALVVNNVKPVAAPAPLVIAAPPPLVMATTQGVVWTASDQGSNGQGWSPAAAGPVPAGTRLETGEVGSCELRFADGSTASLGAASVADITAIEPGKHLELRRGTLVITAAKQPNGQPLLVTTAHAVAQVVGTRFTLGVAAGATTLEVEHGSVRFTADGATSTVTAGKRVSTPALPGDPRFHHGLDLQSDYYVRPSDEQDLLALASPWATSIPNSLDDRGWPIQAEVQRPAVLTIASGLAGNYPGGRMRCTWRGAGSLRAEADAHEVARGPDWLEIDVIPTNAGIRLCLTATTAGDPLRDLHILPVGAPLGYFRPETIRRFKDVGIVRSGSCGEGFGKIPSLAVDWATRPTPDDGPWYRERGRPWEHVIDLARALDADLWLNVPVAADEAYVRALANLVARDLPNGRMVYLELGRDLWDEAQPSGRWFAERAGLHGDEIALAKVRQLAAFTAFEQVLGRKRVVRVISGLLTSPYFAKAWLAAYNDGEIDALALNCAVSAAMPAGMDPQRWDLSAVRNACEVVRRRNPEFITEHLHLARARGLRLLGYQVGPVSWPADYRGLSAETIYRIHRLGHDPELGQVARAWAADWDALVGDVNCRWFDPWP